MRSPGTHVAGVDRVRGWRIVLLWIVLIGASGAGQRAHALSIAAIQGAGHRSPYEGRIVETTGIVTAHRRNGFFLQDPAGDGDPATSEAVFVFTGRSPDVSPGDRLRVTGLVSEFTPGAPSEANLSLTEVTHPTLALLSRGQPLPAPVQLGDGGRSPPTEIIDDDGFASFDPESDGIDFYESLESMRVVLEEARVVAPTSRFGETFVVADRGEGATGLAPRGVLVASAGDANPEKILIDAGSALRAAPGDRLGRIDGVLRYSFGAYRVFTSSTPAIDRGDLVPERTELTRGEHRLTIATFNVDNLDPGEGRARFAALGAQIAQGLRSPDILALQEVQDESGRIDDGTTDASGTWRTLIAAITAAGGPRYAFADVAPVDGQDGGVPGGNIRVGFLYDPARVTLVPGSLRRWIDSSTPDAFRHSRKPLQAAFRFRGVELLLIANHFVSRRGSSPLFGAAQPPLDPGARQRAEQAEIVHRHVESLLAADPEARIVVLGDLNALSFEEPLARLAGDPESPELVDLATLRLAPSERYSFNFEGNADLLDHLLLSRELIEEAAPELDIVHLNSEFRDAPSDHDPLVARLHFEVPEPPGLLLLGGACLVLALRRAMPRSMRRRIGSASFRPSVPWQARRTTSHTRAT
ncbi:MAG: endonuclease/exonuclease/phosphatase family protein [Myxococcota bacterium]